MQLTKDVRRLTIGDYRHAIDSYVARCADIRGVSAIYQFGNIGAPGLSDIDLMVVLRDDAKGTEDFQRLSIRHPSWQDERVIRDCFIHNPFVCPESVFREIDWIIPGNEWTHLSGDHVDRREPTHDENKTTALIHGLDFAIARVHQLVRAAQSSAGSLRWLVPQLWSVTHTRKILERLGAPLSISWSSLIDRLAELRAMPLEELEQVNAAHLMSDVTAHFENAIDLFAQLQVEQDYLPVPELSRSFGLVSYRLRALHVYAAARHRAARTSSSSARRRLTLAGRTMEAAWTRLDLPPVLLAHHLAYVMVEARDSRLVERVARQTKLRLEYQATSPYWAVLKRRVELVRSVNEALEQRGIAFSHMTIPGLLTQAPPSTPNESSWRQRLLMSWLDWRALPGRTLAVGT
jgi:hypothetical protein